MFFAVSNNFNEGNASKSLFPVKRYSSANIAVDKVRMKLFACLYELLFKYKKNVINDDIIIHVVK
ncbi:hypothetical protein DTE93_19710 [Salmonella enterica subsp. enterica]|nr:hypothetical protein [Salmonella enterica subsp. enterica serovar Tananarive]